MLNIGMVIAAGILVIYIILGPIVILGIYAFFDKLAEKAEDVYESGIHKKKRPEDKDPALWTGEDVRLHIKRQRRFKSNNPG